MNRRVIPIVSSPLKRLTRETQRLARAVSVSPASALTPPAAAGSSTISAGEVVDGELQMTSLLDIDFLDDFFLD